MLQAANTELFDPLVPKAHSSECQNLPFPRGVFLKIIPVSNLTNDRNKTGFWDVTQCPMSTWGWLATAQALETNL